MTSKEIVLALGKRADAIRRLLNKMKADDVIEETEQGYQALIPREKRTIPMRSRHDTGKAKNGGVKRNSDNWDVLQNTAPLQRSLVRVK